MATIKEDGTKEYLNDEENIKASEEKSIEKEGKQVENIQNEPFIAAPSIADVLFS